MKKVFLLMLTWAFYWWTDRVTITQSLYESRERNNQRMRKAWSPRRFKVFTVSSQSRLQLRGRRRKINEFCLNIKWTRNLTMGSWKVRLSLLKNHWFLDFTKRTYPLKWTPRLLFQNEKWPPLHLQVKICLLILIRKCMEIENHLGIRN